MQREVMWSAWDEPGTENLRLKTSDGWILADGGLYRFEALDGGFTAVLPVDADGLVLDYPGLFRRAFPSRGAQPNPSGFGDL